MSRGIKNNICLVKLKKIDFFAIPRDWNKLVDTIWNPTPQNIKVVIVRLFTIAFMSSGSVVKALAIK